MSVELTSDFIVGSRFLQNGRFNMVNYQLFELELGRTVETGRDVKVSVKPVYSEGELFRPDKIHVE